MFPEIHFLSFHIHTGSLIMVLCAFYALCKLRGHFLRMNLFAYLAMMIGLFILVFLGARGFHVLVEKPDYFMKNPHEILAKFDGMTFYGSFLVGLGLFGALKNFTTNKEKYFDSCFKLCALFYGVMRIGCFASGCCWGSLYGGALHVRYFHPDSVMPSRGIPVHPVQLYDAFGGLFIFFLMNYLEKKYEFFKGQLIWIFFILYPLLRITTEEFRGDKFRGENILWGLSVSQVISLVLLIIGVYQLLKEVRVGGVKRYA